MGRVSPSDPYSDLLSETFIRGSHHRLLFVGTVLYLLSVLPTDPETSSGWHSVEALMGLTTQTSAHSVIPNLFRNLFLLLSVPPTDPETSSGWRLVSNIFYSKTFFSFYFLWRLLRPATKFFPFFGGWISHKNQHPPINFFSLFCDLLSPSHSEFISESFYFTLGPSNGSWNKFRMTGGLWAGGYRSDFTDGYLPHTQQTLHYTCLHAPETLDCRRMTSIIWSGGEATTQNSPIFSLGK